MKQITVHLTRLVIARIKQICRNKKVLSLALFGSAVRADFGADGDLDFVVDFLPCAPLDAFTRYFDLKESLERATGRRVNLVTESANRNPYFRAELSETKQLIYVSKRENRQRSAGSTN